MIVGDMWEIKQLGKADWNTYSNHTMAVKYLKDCFYTPVYTPSQYFDKLLSMRVFAGMGTLLSPTTNI